MSNIIKISYYNAMEFIKFSRIMCNNICEIDPSVYENLEKKVNEDEIFCWFLTNIDEDDKRLIDEIFPNTFTWTYSDLLDCYVLCRLVFGQSMTLDTAYVDLDKVSAYKEEFEAMAEEFKLYGQNYYAMFKYDRQFDNRWTDSEKRKELLNKGE